jgi:hypothetical protein
MSAKISVCTPRFCTVYAVSKGKLSIRPSDMQFDESITDDASEISFSSSSSSNYTSTTTQTGIQIGSFAKLWLKKDLLAFCRIINALMYVRFWLGCIICCFTFIFLGNTAISSSLKYESEPSKHNS